MEPAGQDHPESSYDVRALEAARIATTGQIPEQPTRLTRRKRHLVVAADQWNNHAAVWFIRRGHNGEPEDEIHSLKHNGSRWVRSGGSGGSPGADVTDRLSLNELADRFRPAGSWAELIPYGLQVGSTYGSDSASVRFQTAAEAATLTFDDRAPRPIADHGYCLVVYDPQHPPTIGAVDSEGTDLGSFKPTRKPQRRSRTWRNLLPRIGRRRGPQPLKRRRR